MHNRNNSEQMDRKRNQLLWLTYKPLAEGSGIHILIEAKDKSSFRRDKRKEGCTELKRSSHGLDDWLRAIFRMSHEQAEERMLKFYFGPVKLIKMTG